MRPAVWTLAAVVALGCKPAPGVAVGAADAAAEALGPVPAPDGLLGAATAATPDATWSKLQKMTGGVAALLPPTFGGVLCAVGGLDSVVAAEIDGAAPAFATLSGVPADPGWVVAARLASPKRARGVMFEGEAARYGSRESDGLTWVVPRGGSLPGPAAVTPNGWLLVAKDDASLKKYANYTYRSLPVRSPGAGGMRATPGADGGAGREAVSLDVPGSAFADLVPALRAAWTAKKVELGEQDRAMREKSGRAPDFGDPVEIVAQADGFVSGRIDELGDVSSGHVALEVGDASVFVGAELAPRDGPGGPFRRRIDAMPSMGPEPLLGATADAEATLVFTDTERQKGEDLARIMEAGGVAMGSRLGEADRKRLGTLAADWRAGRGKVVTVSVLRLPAKGLLLTTRPDDREALVRALRGAADVLRIANLQAALHLRDVATTDSEDPKLGKIWSATAKAPGPADPAKKERARDRTFGLAWAEVAGEISVVVGEDPSKLLAVHGPKERRLGDDDAIKLPIERVAKDCSVALALQPFKLDPSRLGAGPAPVVIAWGRRADRAVLRAEISGAALNVLARRQLGL